MRLARSLAPAFGLLVVCACAVESVDDLPKVRTDRMPEIAYPTLAEDLDTADDVVEYELDIGVTNVEILPGQTTGMWTYNGSSPGPLLHAKVGDTVIVHATNNLREPTTIHWHGLRIDWRMDGVVHGELVAIEPGETFTYEFVVPDAGTYWYHPHVRSNVQIEAGLYGTLIVHEDNETRPDVDADRMFVLDDIRLRDDGLIASHAVAGHDVVHGRAGNVLLVNGKTEAAPVALAPGRVERWRVVNTANARTLKLSFPGLDVRQIGADGGLWPQSLTRTIAELELPVGARAELEVRLAEGSTSGSLDYLLLTQNFTGQLVDKPYPMIPVVVDNDLATDTPRSGYTADPELDTFDIDLPVNHRIELAGQNVGGVLEFTINGASFPDVPVWRVAKDQLQVIEIENRIGPEHPFHLHGQFFQVLRRDQGNGEFYADEPGWRDTTLLRSFEKVVIATRMENPGNWMYHCHILEHGENGMMAMLEVTE